MIGGQKYTNCLVFLMLRAVYVVVFRFSDKARLCGFRFCVSVLIWLSCSHMAALLTPCLLEVVCVPLLHDLWTEFKESSGVS